MRHGFWSPANLRRKLEMWLSLDKHEEELLYDPQTSGGLLLSLPDSQAEELLAVLNDEGVHAAIKIGAIIDGAVGIAVEWT